MTKYCSKKVLIVCLCFTTILASLLIGKNLYQGTPTFTNIIPSKSSDTGDGNINSNKYQAGRRQIQDNLLRLEAIRHGGINVDPGKTQESDEMELEDDDKMSKGSEGEAAVAENKEGKDDNDLPVNKLGFENRFGSAHALSSVKQKNGTREGNTGLAPKWMPESDPRSRRWFSKILRSLPQNVQKYISNEHKIPKGASIGTQWKIVSEAYRKQGMSQRLPDLINIGVKKSGTNAVGFFVSQHPQICHSQGNEVHFFDKNYEKGYEYYRSRMGFAREDQLSFEKTPKYFVTPDAPRQIAENLPKNIKFILSVRDPVKRAMSDFRHERELTLRRTVRREDLRDAQTTAKQEGKLFEQEVLDEYGNVNASNVIVDTSYYAKHFQNWLKHFSRDRFLIIDLETLEKGAFNKLKEFEHFLNLNPYFEESMFYYDERRHGTCMHTGRGCPAKSTPGFLPKAEPSDTTLKKLYEFYRPSNKEFIKLAGQDFPWAHL